MKKILFLFMVMVASFASAQHVEESKWNENLYVSGSVGTLTQTTDFSLRPQFNVEFGKRLTTLYTMGLNYGVNVNTTGVKTAFDQMQLTWVHKLDVLNLAEGYKDRKWHWDLVGGLGWNRDMVTRDDYGSVQVGTEVSYDLSPKWSLFTKPYMQWNHASDGLNVNHSTLNLSVGATYNIGGRSFKVCKYDKLVAKNERLNEIINELRRSNRVQEQIIKEQKHELYELKNTPADTVFIDNSLMELVGFRINSAEVTPDKMAYLKVLSEKYQDKHICLVGYADSKTGTPEYNLKLSLTRAEAVKDVLVKYGLDESKIEVKGMGGEVQPFESDNDLNRVVIIEK